MDLRDYQYRATRQGLASIKFFKFCAIGLEQEVREINAKTKRLESLEDANLNKLTQQLGDCLWFITNLAHATGLSLEDIVAESLELEDERNTEHFSRLDEPTPAYKNNNGKHRAQAVEVENL
ncbi:MAG: hypothetical protein HC835_05320 [Oscillatoriales cyanobacterium RM2_1_1]|nr:hypothetical protein [Oscillatoriales cyanobacterium SM2_3_0]NJO45083.1 hypothetical protein [Oscillatoriales cyanobacterium RM2_1_1]